MSNHLVWVPAGAWHGRQLTHRVRYLGWTPSCITARSTASDHQPGGGANLEALQGRWQLGHLSQISALFAGWWRTRGPEKVLPYMTFTPGLTHMLLEASFLCWSSSTWNQQWGSGLASEGPTPCPTLPCLGSVAQPGLMTTCQIGLSSSCQCCLLPMVCQTVSSTFLQEALQDWQGHAQGFASPHSG